MGSAMMYAPALALVGLVALAAPSFAQAPRDTCAAHVEALAIALEAEGARRAIFDEHLAMLRETDRRGEERLCRDLADDLRQRINQADV